MASDPFYPVLVDSIFAAQGLIHAGNGALMTMLPASTTVPAAPMLDAPAEVMRAWGVTCLVVGGLYIQSVYQRNRGFQQGSVLLRLFTAFIYWGNGAQWRLAALVEVALAFFSLAVLVLESGQQGSGRRR